MGISDPISEHVGDGTKEYFVWQRNILMLAAGSLALLVSFQSQIVTPDSIGVWSLQLAWVLLAITIILSLIGGSGLHHLHFRMADDLVRARAAGASGFVDAIIPQPQRTCAKLAPWLFAASMLLVSYFGVLNLRRPPPVAMLPPLPVGATEANGQAVRRLSAPPRIIQIVDWPWVPEGQHGNGDYAAFLRLLERIQFQQMESIRQLNVRKVWVEGQSDQTIAEFRRHVLELRDMKPPEGDDPNDQLAVNHYREDLLRIGAAGRLLLAGEIDDVLPLEDHDAWQAAQGVDGRVDQAANEARERAMARRLPVGAVIVLGVGHNLQKWLPAGIEYLPTRVSSMPVPVPN